MRRCVDRVRDKGFTWLLLLVLSFFAVSWAEAADTKPSLTATLVPASAGKAGAELAVSWAGEAGARLSVSLRRPSGSDLPLVSGHVLTSGVNLVALPADAASRGTLALSVKSATGDPLASTTRDLDQLRAGSFFAWESMFVGPGLDEGASVGMGGARTTIVWDDGRGPALYVAGGFLTAGTKLVNRIARWDGTDWEPLTGSLGTGVAMDGSGNPSVKALAVYDGALIVAGFFDNAGGVRVNNIARWDGHEWSALGDGLTGSVGVEALTVYQGQLIAGGPFTQSGSTEVARIARWDGSAWLPLGSGISGAEFSQTPQVFALAVFGDELVAGGNFLDAGGVAVNRIARWNGSAWAALGDGVSESASPGSTLPTVHALAVHDGALIVGGNFRSAGGQPANAIARWDGSAWSALGAGMSGEGNVRVTAIATYGSALIAAGSFATADGVTVNNIASWNGRAWSALQGPTDAGISSAVETLAVFDGALIAAGFPYPYAGGVVVNGLARWDGSTWSTLDGAPGTGVLGEITASTLYEGDLVIAGSFVRAGGETVFEVARWDGNAWRALDGPFAAGVSAPPGAGVTPVVNALVEYNGQLIAGGRFLDAGGVFVNHIARWDGTRWWPLGSDGAGVTNGFLPTVRSLAVYDGALIVGGSFESAGGIAARNIARWDGSTWSALGSGVDSSVTALTVFDGDLIAGGDFFSAGSVSVSHVARWDGVAWSALGNGVNGSVSALLPYDGALVAAGSFGQAGGQTVNRIARWDGAGWSGFAAAGGVGMDDQVLSLASYAGELIAGGRFHNAGGAPVNGIARWDGTAWLPLVGSAGAGVGGWATPAVETLLVTDLDGAGPEPEKLVAAGRFQLTGGEPNWNIGVYGPGEPHGLIEVAPHRLDFGSVIAGWTTASQSVTLSSVGSVAVAIDAIPAAVAPFERTGGTCPDAPFDLAPLSSCTLEFRFAPATAGNFVQSFAIGSDTDGPPSSFELIGTGVIEQRPPSVQLDPDHVSATLAAGETGSATLTIGNGGDQTLDWLVSTAAASSPTGFGDNVSAMTVWDDGRGPALYVAGEGDSDFHGIARWDGHAWSWLGAGVNNDINALAVYDGALIAAGNFTKAGGVTVNRIARWDGAEWTALDMGLTGSSTSRVNALAVYDGALIVAGNFTAASNIPVDGLARWDGDHWSAFGQGLDAQVFALTVYNGELIAAGGFTTVGGQNLNRIARWDGSAWAPLGAGVDSTVLVLGTYDGDLIAAGSFTSAGGAPANRVARWNGSTWSPLGDGVNSQVSAIGTYGDTLVVGGLFTSAGGVAANRIASWDGSAWSALGDGVAARVSALMEFDGDLIAGGSFTSAGGIPADHTARWNGSTWSAMTPDAFVDCTLPSWLSVDPATGSVAGGSSGSATLSFDSSGLSAGTYTANLCIDSNDPAPAPAVVPVSLDITGGAPGGTQTLIAPDGMDNDWFGRSVAIDGDTALVGADAVDIGGVENLGAVYVYVREGDHWTQQARLTADDGEQFDQFGITVALSGDTALIGGGHGVNAAYVFHRDGGIWTQQAKLTASDGSVDDVFGIAVALDGDTALIGARQAMVDGHMNQGAAYVFVRSGSVWSEQAKLTASNGQAFDVFGDAVALDGDTAVVGAAYADPSGMDGAGSAWVFVRNGTTWTEQATLVASDAAEGANFGDSVAVSGNTILIGASAAAGSGGAFQGAAYVFTRSGTAWTEQARLAASDGATGDSFGNAVALDGDDALVGAWFAGGSGKAYTFRRSGASWSETGTLASDAPAPGDQFGDAVALDAGTALVGAWLTDVNGHVDQGAAHVFALGAGPAPVLTVVPDMLDFGSVVVPGAIVGPLTVTVTNTGATPVAISGIDNPVLPFARAGGDCPGGPFELAASASCTLSYIFVANEAGTFAQTLAVASDSPTVTFDLVGVGLAPATLDLDPDQLDVTLVQGTNAERTITITNPGTVDLAWNLVETSDTADCSRPAWLGASPDAGAVAAGASSDLTASLDASALALGTYSANLCFESNDPFHPLTLLPVNLTVTLGEPALTIDPPSLDFGTVPAGVDAGPALFTLTDSGTAATTVDAISAVDLPFVRDGGDCPAPPFELAPGDSCTIGYRFSPTTIGAAAATVHVTGNAGDHTIALAGTGIAGPPTQLVLIAGSGQQATVNTAFAAPLAVQVRDDWNNPVAGIAITFSAPASGPSAVLSSSTATTDANGYASVGATANGEVGSYAVTASGGLGAPVSFALTNVAASVDLAVSISVDREHVRPGELLDYFVVVQNVGSDAADDVAVASTLSSQLDVAAATWICLGPASTGCSASGQGDIVESGLAIPAGGSVAYLVTAPVRLDADEGSVETQANVTAPGDGNSGNDAAAATSWIVLFRDGFEPYGTGTDLPPLEAQAVRLGVLDDVRVDLTPPGATPLASTLVARADDGSGFRIERVSTAGTDAVRLVTTGTGTEHASNWLAIGSARIAVLVLVEGSAAAGEAQHTLLVLLDDGRELRLPLGAASSYRLWATRPLEAMPREAE